MLPCIKGDGKNSATGPTNLRPYLDLNTHRYPHIFYICNTLVTYNYIYIYTLVHTHI